MGHIRYGVSRHLEDAADELIRKSLVGVTRHTEKSDILTQWKEQDRRGREVYVPSGTPDPSHRRGIFTRAWNPERPELNSRDNVHGWRTPSRRTDTLSAFVAEHGASGDDEW